MARLLVLNPLFCGILKIHSIKKYQHKLWQADCNVVATACELKNFEEELSQWPLVIIPLDLQYRVATRPPPALLPPPSVKLAIMYNKR